MVIIIKHFSLITIFCFADLISANIKSSEECSDLSHRLRSTRERIGSTQKELDEFQAKMSALSEQESAGESELAETLRLTHQAELRIRELSSKVQGAQNQLRESQISIQASSVNMSNLSTNISKLEATVKAITDELGTLDVRRSDEESKERNLELRHQMLSNDFDASNRTVIDAIALVEEKHRATIQHLQSYAAARSELNNRTERLTAVESEFKQWSNSEQEHEDRISSIKSKFSTVKHRRDSLRQKDHQLQLELDQVESDVTRKLRRIQTLKNVTLAKDRSDLSMIEARHGDLEARMKNLSVELSHLRSSDLNTSSEFTAPSLDSIRDGLREARHFLVAQGYRSTASLAQLRQKSSSLSEGYDPAVDAQVNVYVDMSSLLTLQQDLNETRYKEHADRIVLDENLGEVIRAEEDLRKDLFRLRNTSILSNTSTTKLARVTSALDRIGAEVSALDAFETSHKEDLSKIQAQMNNVQSVQQDATRRLRAMNTSLLSAEATEDAVIKSLNSSAVHLGNVKRDLKSTFADESSSEVAIVAIEAQLKEKSALKREISNKLDALRDALDIEQREHTQLVADMVVNSNRVENFLHELEDLHSSRDRLVSTADEIKKKLNDSFAERTSLQSKSHDSQRHLSKLTLQVEDITAVHSSKNCVL